MKIMKLCLVRRLPICFTLLLGSSLLLTQAAEAGRFGGVGRPAGNLGGNRIHSNVNLQRGNDFQRNHNSVGEIQNRPINNNLNRQRINNTNVNNINRNNINRNNNFNNINRNNNVNISGNEVNVNRRGWYGRGYYTPPAWGIATFGTGLAIGAALNAPPPHYTTVVVSGTEYYYADGIYVQPSGGTHVVAAPPIGAVVTYLPEGCSTTISNGVQSFDCSGVVYQPYTQNGSVAYQVVNVSSN
jgi:Family of unknown function (DUF6515)